MSHKGCVAVTLRVPEDAGYPMSRSRTAPPNLERLPGILREIAEVHESLDRIEHEVVQLLRDATPATWEAIADELGIARQTAEKRFKWPKRRRSTG